MQMGAWFGAYKDLYNTIRNIHLFIIKTGRSRKSEFVLWLKLITTTKENAHGLHNDWCNYFLCMFFCLELLGVVREARRLY